jgi:uncharacterized phage protein (TIGR01671 family)
MKFKAWHKERKILLPVFKIEWYGKTEFRVWVREKYGKPEYIWDWKEIELLQSTGLFDENKVELFAGYGGISERFGKYYIKCGKFEQPDGSEYTGFYIYFENKMNRECYRKELYYWAVKSDRMEFNMNIYENPELLD